MVSFHPDPRVGTTEEPKLEPKKTCLGRFTQLRKVACVLKLIEIGKYPQKVASATENGMKAKKVARPERFSKTAGAIRKKSKSRF